MDIASLAGLVVGIVMLLYGIISSGAKVMTYVDYPSMIITIGGSLASVMTSNKLPDFINALKVGLQKAIKEPENGDPKAIITTILDMANVARKDGLLALEGVANDISDEFLKKGVMLVVDGTDSDLVRAILENDMGSMTDRHNKIINFFDTWGTQCPAWGMIGTLIGLINMLKDLSDPSTIGPNMAVALITTFYGSVIANWLCVPVVNKLKINNDNEILVKTLTVEGLLSIQAGENPRIIEEKLKTFLAPAERDSVGIDASKAKEGGEG